MKIVVTGGASGLGEALVRRLASHDVWILDRSEPKAVASGHHFVQTDLSDLAAIDAAVAALPESIDALVNVAGIATAENPVTVLAVNFLAPRHLAMTLAPRLGARGRILNVSSIAGRDWKPKLEHLRPLLDTADFTEGLAWCEANRALHERDPYTFSKRAITAHTLRAAQQGVEAGFTINCVSPGPIETPLYPTFESIMGEAQSEWTKAQTGRIAVADDIAEVLQLLVTGDCGWLNGVDIPVDGGYSAGLESGWVDFASSPVMANRTPRS